MFLNLQSKHNTSSNKDKSDISNPALDDRDSRGNASNIGSLQQISQSSKMLGKRLFRTIKVNRQKNKDDQSNSPLKAIKG